jgi:arylsulfatase A-like enzyme
MKDKQLTLRNHLSLALKAGILFGCLAGFVEGITVIIRFSKGDFVAPLYGTIVYGLLSIPIAVVIGIAGWIVLRGALRFTSGLKLFYLYGMALFALWIAVVSRYWFFRDVFHEKPPSPQLLTVIFLGGAGVVCLILGVVLVTSSSRLGFIRSVLRTSRMLVSVLLILIAGVIVAGLLPAVTTQDDTQDFPGRAIAATGRPNVLLIIVDALRGDRLPCYGYGNIQTPAINSFVNDSIVFEQAYAQASWTRPSFATIYSSLYPSTHNTKYKTSSLPDSVITLAEVLRDAGYVTGGFANNPHVTTEFNFDQGYDQYTYLSPDYFFYATASASELAMYKQLRVIRERFAVKWKKVEHYYQDAQVVTDFALSWLEEHGDKPFFLSLHYMETHDPYFAHPYSGEAYARVANPNPSGEMAPRYSLLYDREIEYLDTHLDRLFRALKRRGQYESMLIVLTSDHGEEFYEHGGWWHGQTLYEEQVRIPVIVKLPYKTKAGDRRKDLVRHLDIAPTVALLAGAETPPIWQGRSVFDMSAPPIDFVFYEEDLEGNVLTGGYDGHHKVVFANKGNPRGLSPIEMFNLHDDPLELQSMYDTQAADQYFSRLAEQIESAEAFARTFSFAEQKADVSEEVKARMRALGYTDDTE